MCFTVDFCLTPSRSGFQVICIIRSWERPLVAADQTFSDYKHKRARLRLPHFRILSLVAVPVGAREVAPSSD